MGLQVLKSIRTEQMELEYLVVGREEEVEAETAAFERLGVEVKSSRPSANEDP